MAVYQCVVGATFAHLEMFLQKIAALDIFDTLIFNYRLKPDLSQDHITINFKTFVREFSHQLQVIAADLQFNNETSIHQHLFNLQQVVLDESNHITSETGAQQFAIESHNSNSEFIETKFLCEPENISVVDDVSFPSQVNLENSSSSSEELQEEKPNIIKERQPKKRTRNFRKVTRQKATIKEEKLSDDSEVPVEDANLPFFCCRTCSLNYATMAEFSEHICTDSDLLEPDPGAQRSLVPTARRLLAVASFICGTCHEEYRSVERMSYHLPRCRPGPYPCHICKKAFAFKNTLNQHKKDRHRDKKCFKCDECGANFQLRTSLQKHQVNQHERQQPSQLSCPHCQLSFNKRVQLTNHCIAKHSLEKTYLCQVCGMKFFTQGSLTTHIKVHTQPRMFTCAHCDKKFQAKEKLLFHTRIHTGERPHLCPTCGKGFIRKSKLDEHTRRHRGEKRFRCSLCDKPYAGSWDLKLHLKKVHGEQKPAQDENAAVAQEPECVGLAQGPDANRVYVLQPGKELQQPERQVYLQLDNASQHFFQMSTDTLPNALVYATKLQGFGPDFIFS